MIPEAHKRLLKWGVWERIPVAGVNIGYAPTTITGKLMDGRGEFLPGAPRGSGPVKINISEEMMMMSRFVKRLERKHKKIVYEVYAGELGYSMEERAIRLQMSRQSLYCHLHKIHFKLMCYVDTPEVAKRAIKKD